MVDGGLRVAALHGPSPAVLQVARWPCTTRSTTAFWTQAKAKAKPRLRLRRLTEFLVRLKSLASRFRVHVQPRRWVHQPSQGAKKASEAVEVVNSYIGPGSIGISVSLENRARPRIIYPQDGRGRLLSRGSL